jgi:hypothetical protein
MARRLLKRFRPGLSLQEVHAYFAHTNSAKCCQNNDRRRQAHYRLFANCRGFLAGELEALRPDIVVSQGNLAKDAILASIPPFEVRHVNDPIPYSILNIAGTEALWLQSYHPHYFGGYYRQKREFWPGWEGIAFEMFKGRASAD